MLFKMEFLARNMAQWVAAPAVQAWYLTVIPGNLVGSWMQRHTSVESQTHKARWEEIQVNLLEAQWSVTEEDPRREPSPQKAVLCGMLWYFSLF